MKTSVIPQVTRYIRHIRDVSRYKLKEDKLSPNRFVIFGRGRSGSTALVSLLDSLPNLYCDSEILNQRVLFPFSHILAKCAKSNAETYGCKILSYQIKTVQPIPNQAEFLNRLHDNEFKIIYLKRENLIYHALSNIRARQFGYHTKTTEKQVQGKIKVDLNELLNWITASEDLDLYEKTLLESVPHLSLTYEKNLLHSETHQPTLELICDYLNIECSKGETQYRKGAPKTLRDSVENYEELVKFVKDTPYEKFLD